MGDEIWWDADAIAYVRSRGQRYADGVGIEREWAEEVMSDVDLLALEPDRNPESKQLGSSAIPNPRGECWW